MNKPVLPSDLIPVPQTPNPKITRALFALLEEHFDDTHRQYRPGWTDAKIAKTLQVSETVVATTRRTHFGEMQGDPEIAALRSELDRALDTIAALAGRLDAIERRQKR